MADPTTNKLTILLATLRRTRLIDGPQLAALAARPDATGDDPKPLAKFLLQSGLLTRYQLNQLAAGRDKDLLVGPYRLLDKSGETPLGTTYKAQHELTGRIVALKRLAAGQPANAETIHRFQAEFNSESPPPALDAGTGYIALDAPPPASPIATPTGRQDIVQFEAANDFDTSPKLESFERDIAPSRVRRRQPKSSTGKTYFGIAAGATMHIAAVVLLVLFMGGYFTWRATKPPTKAETPTTIVSPTPPPRPIEKVAPKPPEAVDVAAVPVPTPNQLSPLNFTAAANIPQPDHVPAPTKIMPLVKPFDAGHTGTAFVAAMPDGKAVLSGGRDGQLILWDAETGKKLRTVPTPHKIVALAMNLAGTFAATGGDDRAVRIWDLTDLREVGALEGHPSAPSALAFSANGKYVLAAAGTAAKLWDLTDRKAVRDLSLTVPITTVAISPDGHRAAFGSDRGPIHQYDLETARPHDTFNGHVFAVHGVAYNHDGSILASVGDDRNVRFWDATGIKKAPVKVLLRQPLKAIAFAGDGSWAVVGGESSLFAAASDGSSGAVDLGDSSPLASVAPASDGGSVFLANDRGAIRQLLFTGGAKEQTLFAAAPAAVARGSKNATVSKAKSKAKGKITTPTPMPTDPPPDPTEMTANAKLKWDNTSGGAQHQLQFTRDGRGLMSVGADKSVRLWDATTGTEKFTVPAVANLRSGACLMPDGTGFVASGNAPTVLRNVTVRADCLVRRQSFDGKSQPAVVCAMTENFGVGSEVTALALSSNGQYVATGGPDYTVRIWPITGGVLRPTKTYIGPNGRITAVDFHPKQEVFAGAGADGTAWIWQGNRKKPLPTSNSAAINSIAFSSDGRYVLGCGTGFLAVWDWNAGTVAKDFRSTPGVGVTSACWSPNGQAVVVTTTSGGAVAYDLESQRELARMPGPGGLAHGVAVAADNKTIAISGRGLSVYQLDKPLGADKPAP